MYLLKNPTVQVHGELSEERKAPLSILVVEDGKCTADILGMFFETEGHRVRVAYNGVEAINLAVQELPDLVLMDLALPEMNGLHATEQIRLLQKDKPLIVVALSGFDDDELVERCSECGFDAYISKPADPEELKYVLRNLV